MLMSTIADLTAASAGDINSFAATVEPDTTGTARALSLFSSTTPAHVRAVYRNDPSVCKQYYVVFNDKVTILTRPTIATDATNRPIYLASMGDQLDIAVAVSLPSAAFEGHIITLVSKRDATIYSLPTSTDTPLTIDGPPDASGNPVPAGADRLNWSAIVTTEDSPRIVAIPMACPVIPKEHVHDGLALSATLTLEQIHQSPVFATWFQGMAYLHANNAGSSINSTLTIFDWNDVDATNFVGYHLQTSINVVINGLNTFSPHFYHVNNIFKEERAAALYRYASTNAAPSAAAAPPTNAPDPQMQQALLLYLQKSASTTHTTTSTERDQLKEAEEVEHRYMLIFGRIKNSTDPLDSSKTIDHVVYPKLTAQFRDVLNTAKASKANTLFQDHIMNHVKSMAVGQLLLDTSHDLPSSLIDPVFSTCIRTASWAVDPPVLEPESVKDKLGIYHFATPRLNTVTYQARTAAGRTTMRQEKVGEEKSKISKKTSDLYCNGHMDNADYIITMIANLWVFCTFAIEDFATDPPAIWTGFSEFIQRLKSQQGKNWTNKHAHVSHVYYHMVSDLQNMLCVFVQLSNNFEYRIQAKNKLPISPQAYTEAIAYQRTSVQRLNNILVSADLGDYRDEPPIMALLAPTNRGSSDGTKQNTTPIKPTPSYGSSQAPTAKMVTPQPASRAQKADRRPPNNPEVSQDKINEMKAKGLVKFTGVGKPPVANDIFVTNPKDKDKKTMICTNHITVGYYCKHGPKCNFLHAFKLDNIPPVERKAYCAFVDKTSDLEWVNKPKTTVG